MAIHIDKPPWRGFTIDEKLIPALIDPEFHASALDKGEGRGAVYRVALADGTAAIVRRFRRGGFIRHFLRDRYLFDNRPLKEWEVSNVINTRSLPIARPLGVIWRKDGPAYSGLIATEEVLGRSLADMRGESLDSATLEAIGRTIARFHDCCVYHADLNAGNILLAESGPVIIDWDRGVARERHAPSHARANMKRLARSLAKLGFSEDSFASIQRGYATGFEHRVEGGIHTWAKDGQSCAPILTDEGGEIKRSSKAISLHTPTAYVKRTPRTWSSALRCALRPNHFRENFYAALRLDRAGISVAMPLGLAERRVLGVPVQQAAAAEWLEGAVNVEVYARTLVAENAEADGIAAYLERLADAVRALAVAGIHHADLSGKNIFTPEGVAFTFIDLDSVQPTYGVDEAALLKRDVQLYDSFCDLWPDEVLRVFIAQLHCENMPTEDWFSRVCEGQAARRARTEAIWATQEKDA